MIHENVGGIPNVMTATGGSDHDRGYGYTWIWAIFALVIIFFALIFWGRNDRDHRGYGLEALAPALALNQANKNCGCGGHHSYGHDYPKYEWDAMRDNLREFGDVKKEIMGTTYAQSREMDRYFYDQRAAVDKTNYDTLLGFKQNEVLMLQNTDSIKGQIAALERRQDDRFYQETIRRQGEEINYLKTVMALAPRPIQPSYPVQGPVPYQFPHHECAPVYA